MNNRHVHELRDESSFSILEQERPHRSRSGAYSSIVCATTKLVWRIGCTRTNQGAHAQCVSPLPNGCAAPPPRAHAGFIITAARWGRCVVVTARQRRRRVVAPSWSQQPAATAAPQRAERRRSRGLGMRPTAQPGQLAVEPLQLAGEGCRVSGAAGWRRPRAHRRRRSCSSAECRASGAAGKRWGGSTTEKCRARSAGATAAALVLLARS